MAFSCRAQLWRMPSFTQVPSWRALSHAGATPQVQMFLCRDGPFWSRGQTVCRLVPNWAGEQAREREKDAGPGVTNPHMRACTYSMPPMPDNHLLMLFIKDLICNMFDKIRLMSRLWGYSWQHHPIPTEASRVISASGYRLKEWSMVEVNHLNYLSHMKSTVAQANTHTHTHTPRRLQVSMAGCRGGIQLVLWCDSLMALLSGEPPTSKIISNFLSNLYPLLACRLYQIFSGRHLDSCKSPLCLILTLHYTV